MSHHGPLTVYGILCEACAFRVSAFNVGNELLQLSALLFEQARHRWFEVGEEGCHEKYPV